MHPIFVEEIGVVDVHLDHGHARLVHVRVPRRRQRRALLLIGLRDRKLIVLRARNLHPERLFELVVVHRGDVALQAIKDYEVSLVVVVVVALLELAGYRTTCLHPKTRRAFGNVEDALGIWPDPVHVDDRFAGLRQQHLIEVPVRRKLAEHLVFGGCHLPQ